MFLYEQTGYYCRDPLYFCKCLFLLVAALIVLSLMGIAGAVGEQLLVMVSRVIVTQASFLVFLPLLDLSLH
jgi:hypothetical protein